MAMGTYKDACIDAVDPVRLGTFWGAVLGLDVELLDGGETRLAGFSPTHTVWVNRVPEPKSVKHRVHMDVHGSSVEELVTAGATVVDAESSRWIVMADPEGGEFCAFPSVGPT